MKILITFCVILVALVATSDARCKVFNATICAGESYQRPGVCEHYECYENDSKAVEVACPDPFPKKGCRLGPMHPDRKFPDCCPTYEICHSDSY